MKNKVDKNTPIGTKVRIISNTTASENNVGDLGIITEHDEKHNCCRIKTKNRENSANWTDYSEIELFQSKRERIEQLEKDVEWLKSQFTDKPPYEPTKPEFWYVKKDDSNPLWDKFKEWFSLNAKTKNNFSPHLWALGFHGRNTGWNGFGISPFHDPENKMQQITLEQWYEWFYTEPENDQVGVLYPLFLHMSEQHDLTLLDGEMWDIIDIVKKLELTEEKPKSEPVPGEVYAFFDHGDEEFRIATYCGLTHNFFTTTGANSFENCLPIEQAVELLKNKG